jgi:AraC-like DNA-binding protein
MEGHVIFFCQDFYVEEFSFLRLLNLFSCTSKLTGEVCNPLFNPEGKDFNSLFNIVSLIDSEYDNFTLTNNSATIIRSLLNIMLLRLTEISNLRSENKSDSDTVLVHELSRLVDAYFIKEHNVNFYTSAFNISEKHLNDICNKHFNCGLKKILKDRLMQEARKLILSSELSVSEISYKLNFEDNSYFTKVFKQETGITPKKFRELHKKLVP